MGRGVWGETRAAGQEGAPRRMTTPGPKTIEKTKVFHRFSYIEGIMEEDGGKMARRWPKMAQDGPKMVHDGSKFSQEGPKTALRGPLEGPREP